MDEAALHIVNTRSLPHTAHRDELTSEKEQGEGDCEPGFGRKHMKEHQKQRQRVYSSHCREGHSAGKTLENPISCDE